MERGYQFKDEKKNAVKSNLHNLLERQREKNIGT